MGSWLNSNWLDLLISVLVAIIEAAMIAPWLALFMIVASDADMPASVPIGAGIVGLIAFWSARELLAREWDVAAMRMASLGIWLVAIIVWYGFAAGAGLTAPIGFIDGLFSFEGAAFGVVILGALAWWRGLWLASSGEVFSPSFIRRAVLLTVVAHALVLGVATLASDRLASPILDVAAIAVPISLVASLLAATAVQVWAARSRVHQADGKQGAGWLGAGTGIAALILVVAGIVAGTADSRAWGIVFWPVIQLLRGIEFVLNWILFGFAYALFILLWPFFWLADQLTGDVQQQSPMEEAPSGPFDGEQATEATQVIPDFVVQILQWSVVMAIVAVVVWLALRQLRKYQQLTGEEEAEEVRESVFSRDAFMDDLNAMLRGLRPRWGSRRAPIDLSQPPGTVRDAYRYVMVHAGQQGLARDPQESPTRYATRLKTTEPNVGDPIDDLTERYLRARYAERTSDEDAESARLDWDAIRQRLRRHD